MDQDHLFGDPAQQQGILHSGVAATHHRHGFALVKHPIAMGTVVHTAADQLLFSGHSQFSGGSSRCDDDGSSIEVPFAGVHHFRVGLQVHTGYFHQFRFGPKPFGALLHLHPQLKAVNALGEPGIIVDHGSQGHLSAGGKLLQHHGLKT